MPFRFRVNRYETTIWHVLIAVACYWLMGAIMMGCGGAPASLSLDTRFSPAEVLVIQDARDQWCDKTGWCPSWSTDGEAHILRATDAEYEGYDRPAASGGFTEGYLTVLKGGLIDTDPAMLWVKVAHEMGHLQGEDHHGAQGCTMFWKQVFPRFTLTCED